MGNEKLLLSPKDIKPSFPEWEVKGVLNPAAIRLEDGRVLLMARVAEQGHMHGGEVVHCPVAIKGKGLKVKQEEIRREEIVGKTGNRVLLKNGTCRLRTFSHFRRIWLKENGVDVEKVEQEPFFYGQSGDGKYGVEDPRITEMNGWYAMTYVSVSLNEGVSTSLAWSRDLMEWERKGIIFREQNKDVVLFPEKINGKFVALHRPEGFFAFSKPSIWISHSPNLVHWGEEKSIVQAREKGWDSERIGAGVPPIKTPEGWLELYHGVKQEGEKKEYSAGALLLGLDKPEKVIARSPEKEPLFSPEEEFEKSGYVNNVVFPTGAIKAGKDLLVYYGGADSVIGVKRLSVKEIMNHLE